MSAPSAAPTAAQWDRVLGRLRAEFGDAVFKSWLKPLTFANAGEGEVIVSVPTRFMRDWVERHYLERIRAIWCEENASVRAVVVRVHRPATPKAASLGPNGLGTQNGAGNGSANGAQTSNGYSMTGSFTQTATTAGDAARAALSSANMNQPGSASTGMGEDRADISAPLDPRFTFENFVVGKSNEFAYAAARRLAEAKTVPFNPLFLYGGVGLGKTHLMHAIAWAIRERNPAKRVIYLSAEKFMYQFIRALRFRDTMAFKEQFRSVDVLMIDDVQFISGRDSTQEEFFHTFNALVDQNKQIVISADKSPSDLEGMEERMKSRLGWGLVADIHQTDYELRLSILQSKGEKLAGAGGSVPPKVLEFLAHKITSNVRELEGALNRVVAHATLVGRDISLETAQDVLHDLLRANDRRVTIEEIQKRVAEHFNIRISDMSSARRARAVARPRQVAMYLAKQLTSRSLPEIGRKFGGRDHTTVMHAVRKVEELRAGDSSFSEDIDLLRRMLES